MLERLSLVMIVGGIVFEMATGILNIQYDYLFGFNFYTAHYFGAWVFMTGFVVHVALKFPTMVRSLRSRSLLGELRTPLADTEPEAPDADGLLLPGGAWRSLAAVPILEQDFGKPVVTNPIAAVWRLIAAGKAPPVEGWGRLLTNR